jgi:signal transduction histidine kinase
MIKTIRSHLAARLFLAFLGVVFLAGTIHTLTMNLYITSAYDRHFANLGEGVQRMMGNMRGLNLFENFRSAVNESMIISASAALFIVALASIIISRRITRPIQSLTQASRQIAQGRYDQRIPQENIHEDELGQLGTSFNRMAEKLESTEAMRRQLIADISHELRTPLTAIKGSIEGLIDNVLQPNETTYQQIYKEADRLQRLVEDLQELSRVEALAFNLKVERTSIDTLIQTAVNALEPAFLQKGVALESRMDHALPQVMVDPDRMLQVLQNLLGNALQFTPSKGSVVISAGVENGTLAIRVEDNGLGIAAEHLPHIFERFYRADRSRSRMNGGGSGIGLTISKSLVEAHRGTISAASEGLGKGSQFKVILPL